RTDLSPMWMDEMGLPSNFAPARVPHCFQVGKSPVINLSRRHILITIQADILFGEKPGNWMEEPDGGAGTGGGRKNEGRGMEAAGPEGRGGQDGTGNPGPRRPAGIFSYRLRRAD